MRPHDELSNVPKNIRKNSAALKRRAGFFLAAAFSIALMSGTTRAATKTWDGGAGTTNWADANNWSPDGVPASTDDIILDNSSVAGSYTVSLSTAQTVRSLQLGYSGNTNTIELDVSSATTNVLTVSGGGAAALHITDGGVLKNTSTSATRGILLNTATDVFKMSGTGRYIHATTTSGSKIPQRTSSTTSANYNFANTSVFENQSGNAASFDATPTYGSYALNKSGANTANQNLTINGDVSVLLGILNVTDSGTNTFTLGGNVAISSGATLQGTSTTGTGTINITGNVTGAGTLTGNAASDGTASITIGGNLTSQISFGTGTNSLTFSAGAASASFTPANGTTPTVQNVTVGNGTNAKTVTLGANISVASGKTVTVSNAAALNCGTNAVIGAGAFTLSSGATLGIGSTEGINSGTSLGNIRVSGTRTFDSGANYNFNGSSAQVTGNGFPVMVNNFTVSNSAGVTLSVNVTVDGLLALTSGDLNTSSSTLFMGNGATSTGTGDVVGNVNRGDLNGGTPRSFGNPNVQITIAAGTVTAMTVNLAKGSPSDFGNSVRRTYTLKDVSGTLVTATVRLHYLDSELNGNSEGTLELWREDGSNWVSQGATTRDSTDNWVEQTLITSFSPWTIAGPTGPTYVAMVGYSANEGRDGKVLLQWETGEEVNNLGFNIYREDGGQRTRINKSLILGSGLMAKPGTVMTAGRSYLWQASGAKGNDSAYWIEEIDLNGSTVWHGPIFSRRSPDGMMTMSAREQAVADQTVTLEDLATEGAQGGVTLPVQITTGPVKVKAAKMSLQLGLASQDAVKITVKQGGWYRIGKPELVAAGLNPKADPRPLQLYADGVEAPITITPDPLKFDSTSAIEFYAVGLDTPSTDQRVYWLISAKTAGKRIATVPGGGGLPSANSFLSTVERRDRSIYLSGIHNGDAENFFGTPVGSTAVDQPITLQHVDTTAAGHATLEVGMQGFSLTPHSVTVSLNGNPLGAMRYDGAGPRVMQFTVPNNLLSEGQNVVTLAGQQGVVDVSLVDHIRVSYWRAYSADANALKFTAHGNQQVTINGFTSGDVRVLDVTDPGEPSLIAASVDQRDSGYAVTFGVPGTGVRSLLAFGGDQVRSPLKLAANQASTWRTATNQADLVIITHSSLKDSFAQLAALRQSQELKVATVDVEDIYDEFNFGNKSPQAVKDLLSYANSNWKKPPRYVLLAGSASYDPKNYNGFGSYDLVPTKLIDTGITETASDDWFADFDLDGIAELAVGRLPAHTSEEATRTVAKLIAYESSSPQNSALLMADENLGFDFEGANNRLAPLFPAGISVQQINRGQIGTTAAKQQLLDGIASGQKVVNYVGHGSPSGWRDSLLTTADTLALTNAGRYPLFVLMTCLNGEFQHPELNTLATGLMNAQQGGAIAVWASSGLTEPPPQAIMNQRFYNLLFQLDRQGHGPRLGDATMRAKSAISDPDVRRTWILFGDPSMRLK